MIHNYDETLAFIHGRTKFKKIPTLKRMRRLLDEIGAPDKQITAIHVAGTNGKGSTVAFLKNLFEVEGLKVGTYTSPFLTRFNERISVNGKPIPDDDLVSMTQQIYPVIMKLDKQLPEGGPTEFEIITAVMFLYFAKIKVDIAIVEAGLGGLFDSTNVVLPKVSVITSVGWDHMQLLGNTLAKIAYHKAGIIKPGIPAVVGGVDGESLPVIENTAKKNHSSLYVLGNHFSVKDQGIDNWVQKFDFISDNFSLLGLKTTLLGAFQVQNAGLAIQAYLTFKRQRDEKIDPKLIYQAVNQTKWPGRFEKLSDNPTLVIDGAHNISAVKPVTSLLRKNFRNGHIFVLMAILADKQVEKMLDEMLTLPNISITLTDFKGPNSRQVADPEKVKQILKKSGEFVSVNENWQEAIGQIKGEMNPGDLFLITGSLYFISDVRHFLLNDNL